VVIDLVKALATLEVPVPMPVLTAYLSVSANQVRALIAKPFVGGLIRSEDDNYRLFHALFADAVRKQITDDGEHNAEHERAAQAYEARLKQAPRDELALSRLAGHVREARGDQAWVRMIVDLHPQRRTLGMWAESVAEMEQVVREAPSSVSTPLLGNLAGIHQSRGNLEQALKTYLAIVTAYLDLEVDTLDPERKHFEQRTAAGTYSNIGILYETRGELDAAEEMYRKSLALDEELGYDEGIAIQYGNLGDVYRARGEINAAEEMYRKALALNEELGSKEGEAANYGNLGNVYETRGDLDATEEAYRRSLALNEELGSKEGVAIQYGNLGNVYRRRGDLDAAEEMLRKSLAIETELGRKEGMAQDYANLGFLHEQRGDLDAAEESWATSARLFRELGNIGRAEEIEGWIAEHRAARAEPENP